MCCCGKWYVLQWNHIERSLTIHSKFKIRQL